MCNRNVLSQTGLTLQMNFKMLLLCSDAVQTEIFRNENFRFYNETCRAKKIFPQNNNNSIYACTAWVLFTCTNKIYSAPPRLRQQRGS